MRHKEPLGLGKRCAACVTSPQKALTGLTFFCSRQSNTSGMVCNSRRVTASELWLLHRGQEGHACMLGNAIGQQLGLYCCHACGEALQQQHTSWPLFWCGAATLTVWAI